MQPTVYGYLQQGYGKVDKYMEVKLAHISAYSQHFFVFSVILLVPRSSLSTTSHLHHFPLFKFFRRRKVDVSSHIQSS